MQRQCTQSWEERSSQGNERSSQLKHQPFSSKSAPHENHTNIKYHGCEPSGYWATGEAPELVGSQHQSTRIDSYHAMAQTLPGALHDLVSHLYFFMNFRVSSLVSFRPFASSLCFSATILARATCRQIRSDQIRTCSRPAEFLRMM